MPDILPCRCALFGLIPIPLLLILLLAGVTLAVPAAVKPVSTVPAGTVEVGVVKKRFLACPSPVYPEEARRNHLEGAGNFQLVFNREGKVFNVKTLRSTGNRALDVACLVAFFKWRTQPLEFPKANVPVTFSLARPK